MSSAKAKNRTDDCEIEAIELDQNGSAFYIGKIRADILTTISYASVRGKDHEDGAVQRVLNTRRISSIKDYVLTVGHLPSSIILNCKKEKFHYKEGKLIFPNEARIAQLIDGQHRVAGLRAAIIEDERIGTLEVPISAYIDLSTSECASIFLSINTEQKPVPRSLVFDLYGVADANVIDAAGARARDIATALNEVQDSPYRGLIKFPGSPVRRGGIALSTAVTAIKPLVEEKGDFEQRGIHELEAQTKIIINWFKVLQRIYGDKWFENTNAFMFASGFSGAMNFLRTRLLTSCQDKKSFTTPTMLSLFDFDRSDLIAQQEVKGKDGKEAPQLIEDRLMYFFKDKRNAESDFEI